MEPITLLFILMMIAGPYALYRADKDGWNATFKRLSTMTRANLEAKVPVKELEPIKDMEDWDARFHGKELEVPQVNGKHRIVKRDFDITHLGPWPRWQCACGKTDREVVLNDNMERAIRDAKSKSDRHVRVAVEQEKQMQSWTGEGTW